MTTILNNFAFTTCFEHVRVNDEMHHLSLSFSFVVLPLHSPPSLSPSLPPSLPPSFKTGSHSAPRLASLLRAAECRDYHMCHLQLPLLCRFHVSDLRRYQTFYFIFKKSPCGRLAPHIPNLCGILKLHIRQHSHEKVSHENKEVRAFL